MHRAVTLDQRGCGRSTPLAETPEHDLATNTTAAHVPPRQKRWPTSTLHALDASGHGTGERFPAILVQALADLPTLAPLAT